MPAAVTRREPTVTVPPKADAEAVGNAIDVFHSRTGKPAETVVDLSEAERMDAPGLVFIIAFIAGRKNQGFSCRIELPRSPAVRQFMQQRKFPQVLERVTGSTFSSFVGENQPLPEVEEDSASIATSAGQNAVELLASTGFFDLQHWAIAPDATSLTSRLRQLLRDQDLRWNSRLIQPVLQRLIDTTGYMVSHVVYEAISNSFRHAAARHLISATEITLDGAGDPEHLTLVYWDDGEHVYETLGRALREGRPIIAADAREVTVQFRVASPESREPHIFDIEQVPKKAESDDKLLLAAFMPGVSCDLTGRNAEYHPSIFRWSPTLARPGSGLFNVLNGACHIYGGTVEASVGDLIMHFSGDPDGTDASRYKYTFNVRITRKKAPAAAIFGNNLVVRVPTIRT